MPPRKENRKKPNKKPGKMRAGGRSDSRRESGAKSRRPGALFEDLLALQARLRGPNGCPWDREQTHASLRTFLLEETHEVLDAMESGDADKFASELGDLLLQIVFHSLIASETNQFEIRDVIESIHTKMVRRHPHVFGDVKAATSAQVLKNWEQLKAEERRTDGASQKESAAPESLLSGIPRSLPALMEANQLTRRAARIGFDWQRLEEILDKLLEETNEVRAAVEKSRDDFTHSAAHSGTGAGSHAARRGRNAGGHASDGATQHSARESVEEEAGDLLFVAANVARFLGLDPEIALKKANRKFTGRFEWMEREALRRGAKLTATDRAQMEDLWNEAKKQR
ncbi:MAG: nucleoside triphosphate pyrophosphohydrolase [Candidatus Acidiferrales bacterium]